MQKTKDLEPCKFYHIYTRGNNSESVFVSQESYLHFLQLYRKYVAPFVHTYCYCLLPNHVHFLIQVKEAEALLKRSEQNQEFIPVSLQRQWGHLLNAFTKAMNIRYGRVDSLFQKRFRRKEVTSEAYFTRLIFYIHFNPQHHGLIQDFKDWPYSSYHSLLSKKTTNLERDTVLEWFGDREHMERFHREDADFRTISPLIEEDEL
ncbi:transposase [Rufibacter quisquiliarum]|uniref:transposase n=1 Tax=Rufibacter quisquiliarum TaxID=1549639 RepID=UPI00366D2053